MTDAPERIWAFWTPDDFDDSACITAYETTQHGGQEYIRADHALALVAEAYEVAAVIASDNVPATVKAAAIRAMTPSDALAAREARDKRVRDEALREAKSATLQITYHDDRDDCLAAEAIEALMEGNDNEQ